MRLRSGNIIIGDYLPFDLTEDDLKSSVPLSKKCIRKFKKLCKQIDKEIKQCKKDGLI